MIGMVQLSQRRKISRAFTLVELIVSLAIFALMTALVVVKYGNFNQSVLLKNQAYDVALTIRTAQTYGISVKSADESSVFTYAYGVNFNTGSGNCASEGTISDSKQFVMFSDASTLGGNAGICDGGDIFVSSYALKRGGVIDKVCAGLGSCTLGSGVLNVSFKRPDPRATICWGSDCSFTYAEIQLKSTDGGLRTVVIRSNGQVTVVD